MIAADTPVLKEIEGVEVTPEMIRAGIDAYGANDGYVLEELVLDVWRAMCAARTP